MGKLLRVSLNELKLPVVKGGCGLICIREMIKSLRLSQFLRLLKNGEERTLAHVKYWVGEIIDDIIPGMALGEHGSSSRFFDDMAILLADAKLKDIITVTGWKMLTNRAIYKRHIQSMPSSKVELEAGYSFKKVWQRLNSPVLTASCREVLFLLIHNKLPLRERMFRINMAPDPYCEECFDNEGAVIGDVTHYFTGCRRVKSVWNRVRGILISLIGPISQMTPCTDLISLKFPGANLNEEAVWIIGHYVSAVWGSLVSKERSNMCEEQFFGYLRFKYRSDQCGARLPLGQIHSVS